MQSRFLNHHRELQVALDAVRKASVVTKQVFAERLSDAGQRTLVKDDQSPVTVADYAAQAVVNAVLSDAFPDDPIVGEEDSTDLRQGAGQALCEQVRKLVHASGINQRKEHSIDDILNLIDRGKATGFESKRFWTLDPIDGTKGFLRGEQYAICLALIVGGQVELGVIGCPNLPLVSSSMSAASGSGSLMFAIKGEGAYQASLDEHDINNFGRVHVTETKTPNAACFCESVESGHSSHNQSHQISEKLQISRDPVRMDSQCKYGILARGDADIYLRLPVKKSYVEKIWDHAAGDLLVREAGGQVTDVNGNRLDFSKGRFLSANSGVIATNGKLHAVVLDAVLAVLGGSA